MPCGGSPERFLVIEYVGPRIRARREQLGLTQQELGGAVGRTKSFISQIEKGHAMPSLKTLVKIAEVLGEPVGYFTDP